jgi:hypothetical protein
MNENPAVHAEIGDGGDRTFLIAHDDMAHAPAGLDADAHPDHLVILPQGAIVGVTSRDRDPMHVTPSWRRSV